MELHQDFRPALSSVDLCALGESDDITYAVDERGHIRYTNDAWGRTARQRGATTLADALGQDVLACCGVMRPFYQALYRRAASGSERVEHVYRCPTPIVQQRFRMQLRRLPGGGVLVTHHLIYRAPHVADAQAPHEPRYRSLTGIITQCAYCRLTRRADQSAWDWVPDFVATSPMGTSHGICTLCFSHNFPALAAQRITG